MSRMMLPFYLIEMLTPFVRSYADIVGIKVMLFINVVLFVVGSVICMLADSLIIYLLGNGILILGYSLDIHMIYIVDMLPANWQACHCEGNMWRNSHGSCHVYLTDEILDCQ